MVFKQTRRVVFCETDASGRVHFTQILKWVEEAEHGFLEKIGVSVFSPSQGWPRVKVECSYRQPFQFGDEAKIELELLVVGASSLTWGFQVRAVDGATAAEGAVVTVLVSEDGKQEIPAKMRALLEKAKKA